MKDFLEPRPVVLVIDDDPLLCDALRDWFTPRGMAIKIAHTAKEGRKIIEGAAVDVALVDQKLPDAEGKDLCRTLLNLDEQLKVIFITAYPSVDNAVAALRLGVFDYLCKPFSLDEVELAVRQALRTRELEFGEQVLHYRRDREKDLCRLVGVGLEPIRALVDLASRNMSSVVITGETGTGKNVVARAIHYQGTTAGKPFLNVNCAAIPDTLVEAELFGYERGAFTGATTQRKGLFELADGGTLVLDEFADMPLHLQPKLLSILDDGMLRRLGGEKVRQARVRVIATTNRQLEQAIVDGLVRQDLYYRLSVIRIHISPLRSRREDIGELCDHLLTQLNPDPKLHLAPGHLQRLQAYNWPGNVRELRNVLERAVLLATSDELHPADLLARQERPSDSPIPPWGQGKVMRLAEVEESLLLQALAENQGNLTRTAKALGVSLSTLKRRVRRLQQKAQGSHPSTSSS